MLSAAIVEEERGAGGLEGRNTGRGGHGQETSDSTGGGHGGGAFATELSGQIKLTSVGAGGGGSAGRRDAFGTAQPAVPDETPIDPPRGVGRFEPGRFTIENTEIRG